MWTFGLVMVASAWGMLFPPSSLTGGAERDGRNRTRTFLGLGPTTGLVTGVVGVGGGFLIVPALVIAARLPMPVASATSLLVISLNSLAAFAGHLTDPVDIPWPLVLTFAALAVAGSLVGIALSTRVPAIGLRKGFAWFTLAVGVGVITIELFHVR